MRVKFFYCILRLSVLFNKLQRLFGVEWDHMGCVQERENDYQGDVYGRSNMSRSFGMKVFLAEIIRYLYYLTSSRNNPTVSMQWKSEAV